MRTYNKENDNETLGIEMFEDNTGNIQVHNIDMMEYPLVFEIDDMKKFISDLSEIGKIVYEDKN